SCAALERGRATLQGRLLGSAALIFCPASTMSPTFAWGFSNVQTGFAGSDFLVNLLGHLEEEPGSSGRIIRTTSGVRAPPTPPISRASANVGGFNPDKHSKSIGKGIVPHVEDWYRYIGRDYCPFYRSFSSSSPSRPWRNCSCFVTCEVARG